MAGKTKETKPEPHKPDAQQPPTGKISVSRLCMVLVALAFLVYGNTLKNGFVLDDAGMITGNALVQKGFRGIGELLSTPRMAGAGYSASDNYRPLSLVIFAAEHELFGDSPAAGHFTNILLYAACVVLLFLFLLRLFDGRKTAVAFVASLLFLLHPIHTEVVANIKSLDELLCFFFAFLALLFFARYLKNGHPASLAIATASLFLSFLSKETVIAFVAIVPVLFFIYIKGSRSRAGIIAGCTILVAAVFLLIRSRVLSGQQTGSGIEFIDNALAGADLATRMATAFTVLGWYLLLLVVPYPLSCDYCFNSIPLAGFGSIATWASVGAYCVLALGCIWLFVKNKQNLWSLAIIFYLAPLALISNIPFLIGSEMAERFLFFPSVGFCLSLALMVERWMLPVDADVAALLAARRAVWLLLPIGLIYAAITVGRNNDWQDNYTLFKTDAEKLPANAKLACFLGNEIVEQKLHTASGADEQRQMVQEALSCLQRAISIYPKYANAYTEKGNAFMAIQKNDSAEWNFNKALSLDARQVPAANNLAVIYLRQGRFADAAAAYRKSLAVMPANARAWYDLGGCCIQMKQYDSAINALKKAIVYDPQLTDAYMQLGLACFSGKRYDEAEAWIKKALDQHPGDLRILGNLGTVYLNAGKEQQALAVFKQVVAADPKSASAFSNLGHCYYRMKQYQDAADMLTRAVTMHSKNDKDFPCLALSFKALGKMEDARQCAMLARKAHPDFSLDGPHTDDQ